MLKHALLKNGDRSVSDEEEYSGSDSNLSSSPGSRSGMAESSDLFKAVLSDIIVEQSTRMSKVEYDRYNAKKNKGDKDHADHASSHRCPSCQAVLTMCRCDLYHGREQKFGHRVHWADEVWQKPLTTLFEYDSDSDSQPEYTCKEDSTAPKPILKHKATCIIIVSN